MKSAKRITSILLALVMLLAVAGNVFAADPQNGSITVTNPRNEQTYTAYKIFDVNYNTDQSAVSYTISTTSDWYNVVKDFAGLEFDPVANNADLRTVKMTNDFSSAEFSNLLKANISGKTGMTLTLSEDKKTASVSGLDLGYYFVTSTSGALCNLTTTTPNASIHDKNDVPFIKTDDQSTVEIGDEIHYELTGKVPDTTGFEEYTYTISDKMSAGLTFQDDVALTIGGATVASDNYTLTPIYNENQKKIGFELTILVMNLQDQIGAEIKVSYSAVTNEAAVAAISNNTAKLVYSNDPTDKQSTSEIPASETVYSAKIVINKYEAGTESKKLSGAKFVLKNAAGEYYSFVAASDNAPAHIDWVETKDAATEVTTDSTGAAEFVGLKDGTYKLEETMAPAGYNLLTEDTEVVINGKAATENNLTPLTATADIANSTGTLLPATGGTGTTLFYVFGSLLVLCAVVTLVVKKRMSVTK